MSTTNHTRHIDEKQVVGTSFIVSISDVLLNFLVAFFSGSTVMLAQALQGLSDMTTAGILFVGVKRSKKAKDTSHPLGYGREIFFWSLIAAMIMFIGTGGFSFYIGLQQLQNPHPLEYGGVAIAMLVFGFSTNLYSFTRSAKRLNQIEGETSWWRRVLHSGMVETKTTFTVDLMGTIAAIFGLVAFGTYILTGDGRFDGAGAMLIGLSTMIASILIMVDAHGLIVGRAVSPATMKRIKKAVLEVEQVNQVVDLYAIYIGSDRLLVIIEVHLKKYLSTKKIEEISDEIKSRVHQTVPAALRVQVEVETPDEDESK